MVIAARSDPTLELIAHTIVDHVHPRRIVLFGSRARGDAHADSDYDIMVELDHVDDPRRRSAEIHALFSNRPFSLDVIVQAPDVHQRQRTDPGWLDYDIAREGVVLYAAPAASPTTVPPRFVRERDGGPGSFTSISAWLERARRDLAVAEVIGANTSFWDEVCFHCQQAGEKALKTLLIERGHRPRRTHSLVKLLAACREAGCTGLELDDACARLTPYAVASRYPESAPRPSESHARTAIEAARQIVEIAAERVTSG